MTHLLMILISMRCGQGQEAKLGRREYTQAGANGVYIVPRVTWLAPVGTVVPLMKIQVAEV